MKEAIIPLNSFSAATFFPSFSPKAVWRETTGGASQTHSAFRLEGASDTTEREDDANYAFSSQSLPRFSLNSVLRELD